MYISWYNLENQKIIVILSTCDEKNRLNMLKDRIVVTRITHLINVFYPYRLWIAVYFQSKYSKHRPQSVKMLTKRERYKTYIFIVINK